MLPTPQSGAFSKCRTSFFKPCNISLVENKCFRDVLACIVVHGHLLTKVARSSGARNGAADSVIPCNLQNQNKELVKFEASQNV